MYFLIFVTFAALIAATDPTAVFIGQMGISNLTASTFSHNSLTTMTFFPIQTDNTGQFVCAPTHGSFICFGDGKQTTIIIKGGNVAGNTTAIQLPVAGVYDFYNRLWLVVGYDTATTGDSAWYLMTFNTTTWQRTGKWPLDSHSSPTTQMTIDPKTKHIFWAGDDNTVIMQSYDTAESTKSWQFPGIPPIVTLHWLPDMLIAVTGDQTKTGSIAVYSLFLTENKGTTALLYETPDNIGTKENAPVIHSYYDEVTNMIYFTTWDNLFSRAMLYGCSLAESSTVVKYELPGLRLDFTWEDYWQIGGFWVW